jgi:predicted porin
MKRKLIAAAVAGALVAPAAAFAQSTVNIYGQVNVEYGFAKQPNNAAGASRHNYDRFNSGNSHLGFRGEEKLGGGMSAWFQCESDLRFLGGGSLAAAPADNTRGAATGELCDRNSAIGFRGGFGNVFLGTWDNPMKRMVASTRMLDETGWHGVQNMLLSNSLRNANSISYDSPRFSGFQLRAQTTTTQAAQGQLSTVNNVKGRINSVGVDYTQGPLVVAAAWQNIEDGSNAGTGISGRDFTTWGLGANYTIGALKLGLTYTDQERERAAPGVDERKSWALAGEYKVSGPGMIRVGYTRAGDFKGNGGVTGVDTGAKNWQVLYFHSLSKRTVVGVGYARFDNDRNGTYNHVGQTGATAGGDASAFVLRARHRF